MKNVAAGANPMVVKKGMQMAVDAAVEAIKSEAQPVNLPTTSQELLLFPQPTNTSAS